MTDRWLAGKHASAVNLDAATGNLFVGTFNDGVYVSTDGGATFVRAANQDTSIAQGFSSFVQMWNSFPPDQIDKHKDDLHDGNPAGVFPLARSLA